MNEWPWYHSLDPNYQTNYTCPKTVLTFGTTISAKMIMDFKQIFRLYFVVTTVLSEKVFSNNWRK